MAWGSSGEGTGRGEKTSSNTLVLTAAFTHAAPEVMVVIAGGNNVSTTDGNTNEITSITDSKGNTYTKVIEFCNGQGTAATGAVIALFVSQLTTTLVSGDTITINYANTIDARAACCESFTIAAGSSWSVQGTNQVADDNIDPSSLDVTTPDEAFLRIRAGCSETSRANFSIEFTGTTNWTGIAFSGNGTEGGGDASNICVWAERRIFTGTSAASDPSYENVDSASVYVVLREVPSSASTWIGSGGWF